MTYRFRAARSALLRDPAELRLRERAVLRILNRAGAATAIQLSTLVYHNRRLAQRQLWRLWADGLLERASLPPAGPRGGAPLAYRLSAACLHRLGYRRGPWRGPGYLPHTLDAVEAVCALIDAGRTETRPPVQLWLPESIADGVLADGIVPDAVCVVASASGSGVICFEIDEGTQHIAPIRAKLRAYQRALGGREGWHVLFVVPTAARRTWLRRVAAGLDRGDVNVWIVVLRDLTLAGLGAPLMQLGAPAVTKRVRDVLVDARSRTTTTPVTSQAWLELLASGGGEDLGGILA